MREQDVSHRDPHTMKLMQFLASHHFLIDHNAPCLPPKITVVPREKFVEINKAHYGLYENGHGVLY